MVTPAAMFIESATAELKALNPQQVLDQCKELHAATGIANPQFADGYNLGIQTVRVMLLQNPEIILKGVNPNHVL